MIKHFLDDVWLSDVAMTRMGPEELSGRLQATAFIAAQTQQSLGLNFKPRGQIVNQSPLNPNDDRSRDKVM